MFKTEFITEHERFKLKESVNNFIKDKKIINISYAIGERGYGYIYSCCILYEE